MRLAVLASLAALALSGCPALLAPPPLPGEPVGGACRADLDCDDGLECECGRCTAPDDEDLPPSCDVDLSQACGDPEPCYAACGDLTELGETTCEEGTPVCAAGVREDDCPPETCWGEPQVGEVCDNGEFVCTDGRSPLGGCYTPGACAGDPAACVFDCTDVLTFDQACVAEAFACENGFEQTACGNCIGQPPTCVFDCVDVEPIAPAVCANGEFSCAFVVDAVPATDCGCIEEAVDLLDGDDVALLDGVSCSLGPLFALYDEPVLALPDLRISGEILVFGGTVERVSLPVLEHVWGNLSVNATPALTSFEAPALQRVDGNLSFLSAPNLPTCQAQAVVDQLEQAPTNVDINGTDDDAGCVDADGGPSLDAGPDAG
jgi:hypothetical protein